MKMIRHCLLLAALALPPVLEAASNTILGWNNLGMHCMDSDYSVFSILPPYNTIEAQLIVGGKLVTNGSGYTVTYQAVADPDGSFNSTETGKGNYRDFYQLLYTPATLPQEMGLAGWAMPGTNNTPQAMLFEPTNRPAPGVATTVNWFRAEGIPITPFDDAGLKNPYPLLRIIARNAANQPIATNDVVLPVSDEMDCRACHASGTQTSATPAAGWVWSSNSERDYRLNILRLHDEQQFANHNELYTAALAARGFSPRGLYHGVVANAKPVLCATCHASEALGTGSYSNIPPLTASVHAKHATVMDPDLHITLDNSLHRAACYRCHPGSATKCLRGAMGGAIANDGSMAMQCQSCHGNMSRVGSISRVGWFMEPNCQSCHTGTATQNNGQIRYTSSFQTNGTERVATNLTFATQANVPAPGISLYRFSAGHGGLQCSACHGSTHAEFPATHRNDNLRNIALQGHAGVMVECTSCHVSMSVNATTAVGGPHGMHPVGQAWANGHGDLIEGGMLTSIQCRACHGTDGRGTVLSRMQTSRTIATKENKYGTKQYWRGQAASCYDCHNGPNSGDPSVNTPPVVTSLVTNTDNATRVVIALTGSDGNGDTLAFRVVTQPEHGSVALSNNLATFFPEAGFVGTAQFTFAAFDGRTDSNLATGAVAVVQGPFGLSAKALVPPSYPAQWPAAFTAMAVASNIVAPVTHSWNFGDGSALESQSSTWHAYPAAGDFTWSLISSVSDGLSIITVTNQGTIQVTAPATPNIAVSGAALELSWPFSTADAVVEETFALSTVTAWNSTTNPPTLFGDQWLLTLPKTSNATFYRLRQVK
jgi:Bacterial Ig domain/PKD domain